VSEGLCFFFLNPLVESIQMDFFWIFDLKARFRRVLIAAIKNERRKKFFSNLKILFSTLFPITLISKIFVVVFKSRMQKQINFIVN
jgi:hypothetical protein